MKMIEVKCDVCGKQLQSAPDDTQARRTLNSHKRYSHNIVREYSTLEGRRRAARERHWRLKGFTPQQIAQKNQEYQDKKQSAAAIAKQPVRKQQKPKPEKPAEPIALKECPCCGARFYAVRKDSE